MHDKLFLSPPASILKAPSLEAPLLEAPTEVPHEAPSTTSRGDQCLDATQATDALSWNSQDDEFHTPILLAVAYPGQTLGPYRLVRPLGCGGMGEVWLAKTNDAARRCVALKLIKNDDGCCRRVRRFEAEHHALSMMDHPNIPHVLGVGSAVNQRRYLAMELVDGISLTQYCSRYRLTLAARLNVFVQVCEAVLHSHERGVLHRDLKPGNVLVTQSDGIATAKLIDFGLAQLFAATASADRDGQTNAAGLVVGTPRYMSPEQADRRGPDLDSRSDIYALGVMLYELLTDTTPLNLQRLTGQTTRSILDSIRGCQTPRPSDRFAASPETMDAVAAARQIESVHLTDVLRDFLDPIVMKALQVDRHHRYATADDFIQAITRFPGLNTTVPGLHTTPAARQTLSLPTA